MGENDILKGEQGVSKRALYKSTGFTGEQLGKPTITIASSYTNATPGHSVLKQLCENVKEGIIRAGGTLMESSTVAPCGGIVEGHEGACYILPTRGLITSPIECMAEAHRFGGLVLLGSCDKIVSGTLMVAARLEIPVIFLNGGSMYPVPYCGRHYDGNIMTEAIGWEQQERIDEEKFRRIEDIAEPCPGPCTMLGIANTMSALSESLGMSLMGSSTILTVLAAHMVEGVETGERIVELVRKGVTTRDIPAEETFGNAAIHLLTVGGSASDILHLQTIYHEAGLGGLSLSVFDEFSREIPQVVSIYLASEFDVVDFHGGGGIPVVLKEMEGYLHKDILTASGPMTEETLSRFSYTNNGNMIKAAEESFTSTDDVAMLEGNIAPLGRVIGPTAVPEHMFRCSGHVRVLTIEEEFYQAILKGRTKPGACMVLMYEGPKGGPSMPEVYRTMKHLEGMGLSDTCAPITNGGFSGSNRGLSVDHTSSEACEQGNFALIQDGDVIEIDADTRSIELEVPEGIPEEHKRRFVPVEKEVKRGYLRTYRRASASASKGAVVE